MTNEEKRFKIVKVKKYEDELSKEDRKVTINTFFVAIGSLAAAACFCGLVTTDASQNIINPTLLKLLFSIMAPVEMGLTIPMLRDMVEAIGRKTVLKAKIDEINDDLEFAEEEEKRGIRKWW